MQISDMLGQYSRNVTNGTEELKSAQGTQKMVSTAGELTAGSVFEGTVNHVKNGKVTLALGNGQTITARMSGKVDLKPGTSMFFQVRSNDGATVEIRPYTGTANAGNPILLNALTAAQVPVTERSLSMVDAMMREQLPIGRQGILDMIRVLNGNPGIKVGTLVSMTKLGLPITEQSAVQFEHYMAGRQVVLNDMELALDQMAAVLGDDGLSPEEAFALYGRILESICGAGGGEPAGAEVPVENGQSVDGNINLVPGAAEEAAEGSPKQPVSDFTLGLADFVQGAGGEEGQNPSAAFAAGNPESAAGAEASGILADGAASGAEVSGVPAGRLAAAELLSAGETLGQLFGEEQLDSLTKLLQSVPALAGDAQLFPGAGQEEIFVDTLQGEDAGFPAVMQEEAYQKAAAPALLNRDLTAGEFLSAVREALEDKKQYGFAGLSKLFSGREFREVLKSAVREQWLIRPEDLKEEDSLGRLFAKVDRQLGQMESAMRAAGAGQNSFAQTAAEVRGNIEFMNQMNQVYTYVQMPLKMSGQNANGELYVYSNKKQLRDPDAELTAFLHLDLDNLGTTDVSIRMLKKQVTTNFYFSDAVSSGLVEKHLPILEKHLVKKGYNCKISISNEKKEADAARNRMEDFLKGGQAPKRGLHRYSFDVRA